MAAVLVSRCSSEGSLPPPNCPYSLDSWRSEDDSVESPRVPDRSPLLHGTIFCGDVRFPVTKALLLSISSKLHRLVFNPVDRCCGEIGCLDLDEELQDVSFFLEAGSRSLMQRNAPSYAPATIRGESTFEEVFAIIHLSRKYESAHLYHSAVGWLKRHFSPDVPGFDLQTPPGFLDTGAIGVLNLARTIGSSSLVIGAVFACCRLSMQDLVNGYPRDDRGKERLTLEDMVRVRLTRDRLVGACLVCAICVYRSKRSATRRHGQCGDGVLEMRRKTVDALRTTRPSQQMCFPILEASALESTDAEVCNSCAKMVEAREREAREEIWGLLPCIVDEVVPGWGGKCLKHCPSEELSDSDSEDSDDCCMDGPVHDWMRYRRTLPHPRESRGGVWM